MFHHASTLFHWHVAATCGSAAPCDTGALHQTQQHHLTESSAQAYQLHCHQWDNYPLFWFLIFRGCQSLNTVCVLPLSLCTTIMGRAYWTVRSLCCFVCVCFFGFFILLFFNCFWVVVVACLIVFLVFFFYVWHVWHVCWSLMLALLLMLCMGHSLVHMPLSHFVGVQVPCSHTLATACHALYGR